PAGAADGRPGRDSCGDGTADRGAGRVQAGGAAAHAALRRPRAHLDPAGRRHRRAGPGRAQAGGRVMVADHRPARAAQLAKLCQLRRPACRPEQMARGGVWGGCPPEASTAPWPTLVVVTAGLFLAVLSTTVVSVALPTIGRDLHASATDLEWTVDAYVLVYASLLVAGGVAADRRGRKGTFILGVALFGLGSLAAGLAPS